MREPRLLSQDAQRWEVLVTAEDSGQQETARHGALPGGGTLPLQRGHGTVPEQALRGVPQQGLSAAQDQGGEAEDDGQLLQHSNPGPGSSPEHREH